ncbi:SIMPL domain-containing protein [Halomonas sp. YLGW01]|uniref:SIMPL domain-containing protein n=1 Tax=Halomonas sp. YLGW01 TaxID=2773308 RepID=UPI001F5B9ECF|nr:SIMPL domain-containing protein [Halomonas sp. YLGW01]
MLSFPAPPALMGRRLIGRLTPPCHGSRARSLLGLLLATWLTTGATAQAQPPAVQDQTPGRLEVAAHHTLEVAPDMATLNARLWERTPARAIDSAREASPEALSQARSRLEARMGKLIRTLEADGLPRDAIQAGSLSVQPSYIQGPVDTEGQPERRVRTQLTRPVTLTLDDLEALPGLLDALTTAGVDALDGVSYDLKDRSAASDKALELAIDRAKAKATLMAERLGITLGRVLQVQETQMPRFQPQMMMRAADAAPKESASEYRPGQIEIEAEVAIHWAIADE